MQPPNDPGWQGPLNHPQQPPFYNQPTYPNFPLSPRQPPPRQKKLIPLWALIGGGLLILCVCGGISVAMKGGTPTGATPTAQATPTDTPTAVAVLIATDTATDTPTVIPSPSPTPKPTPTQKPVIQSTPTPKPQPTPTHCVGVNNNPWCYDFSPGNYIYNPPSSFCSYFSCISTFWNGRGFVNECSDGSYSKSGGIRGDCSYHGGEERPLYSH